MVVYLDGVILLNFLIDLMLILCVNRLTGYPPNPRRAAAGAAVGSGYAGVCVLPGLNFLTGWFWRILSLWAVSMAAFGSRRSSLRKSVLFILLSFALGGLVMSLDTGDFLRLAASALALLLLSTYGFGSNGVKARSLYATVVYRGREIRILVMEDTGNTLTDPITGQRVLVAGCSLAQWFGLSSSDLDDPTVAICKKTGLGLRLIPYRAVNGGGILLGIRCDGIWINGENVGQIVAFSPGLNLKGEHQALTGGLYA